MSTTTPRCSICHRPLKDPESIARGAGPVCAGKQAKANNPPLPMALTEVPRPIRRRRSCTRCGDCCRQALCRAGELAYPGGRAPCPGLVVLSNGLAECSLMVAMEAVAPVAEEALKAALGVGSGCTNDFKRGGKSA